MLHRSQIMREKTIYKQMTTSFMGEPIKTYNMMRNSIVALMKDNTKENRNKVVRSFVTLTFNAVAVAAAAAVVDALRDDDDDETFGEIMKRQRVAERRSWRFYLPTWDRIQILLPIFHT